MTNGTMLVMFCSFKLENLEGDAQTIDVPVRGTSGDKAMEMFGGASRQISEEWHARDRTGVKTREWLSRISYQLLGLMIDNGFEELFSERAANYDRRLTLSSDRSTIFQLGLLAIFAHDKGAVIEQARSYIGRRLWFAYRHYVPPEFLIGFLYETWNSEVEARFPRNEVEGRLEIWVKLKRAADEWPALRGPYSKEFEQEVDGIRRVLPALREVHDS